MPIFIMIFMGMMQTAERCDAQIAIAQKRTKNDRVFQSFCNMHSGNTYQRAVGFEPQPQFFRRWAGALRCALDAEPAQRCRDTQGVRGIGLNLFGKMIQIGQAPFAKRLRGEPLRNALLVQEDAPERGKTAPLPEGAVADERFGPVRHIGRKRVAAAGLGQRMRIGLNQSVTSAARRQAVSCGAAMACRTRSNASASSVSKIEVCASSTLPMPHSDKMCFITLPCARVCTSTAISPGASFVAPMRADSSSRTISSAHARAAARCAACLFIKAFPSGSIHTRQGFKSAARALGQ